MQTLKERKANKDIFSAKPYSKLNKMLVLVYSVFILIYIIRDNLYKLQNPYITLLAETAPNLIPSFIFTLIGILYVIPYFKGLDSLYNPMFIWLVNVLNIIIFILIEYLHVILNLGRWDHTDIIASLVGIVIATVTFFISRKNFLAIT